MKKNYILLLLLCLCFAGCKEKTVVESDYLPIADPYVMLYEGKYYAYVKIIWMSRVVKMPVFSRIHARRKESSCEHRKLNIR